MEIIKGAKNGAAFKFVIPLTNSASRPDYKASPTLAAGDVKVARYDTAAWVVANITSLPTAITGMLTHLEVSLTAGQMTADDDTRPIIVTFIDAAGAEWDDQTVEIRLGAMQSDVTAIDGLDTDGNNATLKLKQLSLINGAGDAFVAAGTGGSALLLSTSDAQPAIAVQSTSGRGVIVQSGGNFSAVEFDGSGTGSGLELAGGGSNGHGLLTYGFGSGDGFKAVGGPTGIGFHGLGGATSGGGMELEAPTSGVGLKTIGANNNHGFESTGHGTGHGLKAKGGAMANGVQAEGGSSAGNGMNALAPGNGDGFAATGLIGINAASNSGGGAGFKARGTGSLDIDAAETTAILANLALMAGAGFVTGTDSLEAIRNRGDAAWATSGFGLSSLRTNTAQAGGATTITLDAGASAINAYYAATRILITGGTGAGQSRYITSYVGSSKVATVDEAWITNPDVTSVFEIQAAESRTHELAADAVEDVVDPLKDSMFERNVLARHGTTGKPSSYEVGTSSNKETISTTLDGNDNVETETIV